MLIVLSLHLYSGFSSNEAGRALEFTWNECGSGDDDVFILLRTGDLNYKNIEYLTWFMVANITFLH